ncbi:hypothetical protein E2562_022246, partial [Oryza meyeriana var. granulata]
MSYMRYGVIEVEVGTLQRAHRRPGVAVAAGQGCAGDDWKEDTMATTRGAEVLCSRGVGVWFSLTGSQTGVCSAPGMATTNAGDVESANAGKGEDENGDTNQREFYQNVSEGRD